MLLIRNSRMLNTCIRLVFGKNKIESDFESVSLLADEKFGPVKPMKYPTTSRPPFDYALIFKGAPRGKLLIVQGPRRV